MNKQVYSKQILSAIFSLYFIFCTYSNCLAFRCGKEVTSSSDPKSVVEAKCGQPDYVTTERQFRGGYSESYGSVGQSNRYGRSQYQSGRSGGYTEDEIIFENWHYNCGENDFIYVIRFENDRQISENTLSRGNRGKKCLSSDEKYEIERKQEMDKQEQLKRNYKK